MPVPADIINRVLDAIGRSDLFIGDLEEGTEGSKPALRAYGPARKELLRAVHWNFARKMAPMTLLADATGQSPNVGTIVQQPWIYEYQLPIDCVKARIVPWNNQSTPNNPAFSGSFPVFNGPPSPSTPMMTGLPLTGTPNSVRLIPARFLVALDYNYPSIVGAITDWSQLPDEAEGVGPQQRTVILTNVKNASLIYTADVLYPDQWDSLFEEALVQLLASRLALSLSKDKRFGLTLRAQAVAAAKEAITEARIADGNESFPKTTDHTPDFLRARNAGSGGWNWGGWGPSIGGPDVAGVFGYGWDSLSLGDGSVF